MYHIPNPYMVFGSVGHVLFCYQKKNDTIIFSNSDSMALAHFRATDDIL